MNSAAPAQTRLAVPADGPALARMNAIGWPAEVQVVPPAGADAPFFTDRRQPADVIVSVDPDGDLSGYVHLARHLDIAKNSHVLHVNALVVAPASRGKGISHLLIDAAVAEAEARGVRKLGLRALSTNTVAVALYERHGFVVEGRLREEFRQPDGSWADDLWMARFLVDG